MSWVPHHSDRIRDDFPDATMLRAYGAITVAAARLESLLKQVGEVPEADKQYSSWRRACAIALGEKIMIIEAITPTFNSSQVVTIVARDGSKFVVDAPHLDRLANRLLSLAKTGVFSGWVGVNPTASRLAAD